MAATRGRLDLGDRPDSRRDWAHDVWSFRSVLVMLARKDFQTRYKRASFGVIWAVAVPLLQASVMAVVFSRVVRSGSGESYPVYVMSGVVAYTYFSTVLSTASTAIVDGSGLTDKVWFPRAILVVVPTLSNLVGYLVTLIPLLASLPLFGVPYRPRLLLLVPGTLMLCAFVTSLSLVLSALHVYFRDVRFLTTAALLVWLYVTPVLYSASLLGRLRPLVEANPLTGIVTVFHAATVGDAGAWVVPVAVSIGATLLLAAAGLEAQRRHDRLFVDLL
jgi:lipopolysaccharide transport system permease protein